MWQGRAPGIACFLSFDIFSPARLICTCRVAFAARTKSCASRRHIPTACVHMKTALPRSTATIIVCIISIPADLTIKNASFGTLVRQRMYIAALTAVCTRSPGTKHPPPPTTTIATTTTTTTRAICQTCKSSVECGKVARLA